MRKIKYKINLNETEKEQLEKILNKPSIPQSMANSGEYKNTEISKYIGIDVGEITKWTKRWIESEIIAIEDRLKDRPRSGRMVQNNGISL